MCLCSFFFGFCQQILKLFALIMLLDGVLLIFNLVLPVVELMVYYASIWWRHRWYGHILFIYFFGYVLKLLFRFPVEVKLAFIHLQTFRWLVAFTLIKKEKRKKKKSFVNQINRLKNLGISIVSRKYSTKSFKFSNCALYKICSSLLIWIFYLKMF